MDKQNAAAAEKSREERVKLQDFRVPANEYSNIKKIIGVVSGKGGVGKSLVTALLALQMSRKGKQVGILDADITGPSIPKMFGLHKKAVTCENGILPEFTRDRIRVISINLLLEEEDAPVVWRGPLLSGVVKQFWTDVLWENLDYLFVDMPPGTGDVPLTVFQTLPLDGIVVVASPQDLVQLIVRKAYRMAKTMNIPILGIVENMGYLKCPDCGRQINIFGESRLDEVAVDLELPVLGKLPVDPELSRLCDEGRLEDLTAPYLVTAAAMLDTTEQRKPEQGGY